MVRPPGLDMGCLSGIQSLVYFTVNYCVKYYIYWCLSCLHYQGISISDIDPTLTHCDLVMPYGNKISINKTRLKIAVLKWHLGLPGVNELNSLWPMDTMDSVRELGQHWFRLPSKQFSIQGLAINQFGNFSQPTSDFGIVGDAHPTDTVGSCCNLTSTSGTMVITSWK